MTVRILQGDCLDLMRAMDANSVDAIVTDPPYGLGFMGKEWDDPIRMGDIAMRRNPAMDAVNTGVAKQGGRQRACADFQKRAAREGRQFSEWVEGWAAEALRVAKPGAYLVAFGGTRMFHRLTSGIEDAGWEIRDSILRGHMPQPEDCPWLLGWMYGSGFPKSKNLAGEREGWGTALKPAWEPIVLARKPLVGTVAANVLAHGTGALNIDGCRIGTEGGSTIPGGMDRLNEANFRQGYRPSAYGRDGEASAERRYADEGGTNFAATPGPRGGDPMGRWPANLIHDGSEEVVEHFPQSDGQAGAVTGNEPSSPFKHAYGDMARSSASAPRGDSGSAARFFYCAKASREDRNDGCDGLPLKPSGMVSNTSGQHMTRRDGGEPGPAANNHPTVKPTDLMRWLCRLVTPPGGLILDPFTGSGSTGRGAVLEGFDFVGCELSPEYVAIAEARIAAAVEQRRIETAQGDLFGEAA